MQGPVCFDHMNGDCRLLQPGQTVQVSHLQAATLGSYAVVLGVLGDNTAGKKIYRAWFPDAAPWFTLPQQQPGIACSTHVSDV